MRTVRFEYHPDFPRFDPLVPGLRERYIYAFWHETLMMPAHLYGHTGAQVLISRSEDGLFIAEVCRRIGLQPVLGSSSRHKNSTRRRLRGGVEAVLQLVREDSGGHVVVTPDGPRGPRREAKLGIIYLAAKTGRSIVPVGYGFDRPWRLKSWDQFILPRLGSRAVGITGRPLHVPADLSMEQMEACRRKLEEEMNALMDVAQQRVDMRARRAAA
jgi:lysophospholipid acyltransferase (LPLAT)-like uncharacterized protein